MGDRVAVMKDGLLQQVDTPLALYDRPANLFVAGFIGSPGMNLLAGKTAGDGVRGRRRHRDPDRPHRRGQASGSVTLGIRPESWRVAGGGEAGYPVTVAVVEELGADAYVYATPAVDVAASPGGCSAGRRARRGPARQLTPGSDDPPGLPTRARSTSSTPRRAARRRRTRARRTRTLARPLRAREAILARSFWSSTTLRIRTVSGVTSTHSSSRQNSRHCSSEQPPRRDQLLEVVGGRGPDVGLLLLLGDVDVHVVGARVLADDHALVDLGRRLDEHHAALLQVGHGVRRRRARAVGDQRALARGSGSRRPTARSPRTRGGRCRCPGSR